ncbi:MULTISPECIES: Ms4533A family Cys-rich leader peptide [Streptomycetaceae]|nr:MULTISPECIES: Ms4533A family Cys-rich leader peptide [Streptomycetaceae]
MPHSPATDADASIELALIGVAGHCVADILCRRSTVPGA